MLLAGKRLLAMVMTVLMIVTALPMTVLSEEVTPEPAPVAVEPTAEPTEEPTVEPTAEPTAEPTEEPTEEPTAEPTAEPTVEPTEEPTTEPTAEPTEEPTAEPTEEPTAEPTEEPTVEPTAEPTEEPTAEPTVEPTAEPTVEPTEEPAPVLVSDIVLDTVSAELYVGAFVYISAEVTPSDADNTALIWTSSDENVAVVDENGLVTAIGAGEAVITAAAADMGGASAQCTVTVVAVNEDLILEGASRMQLGREYEVLAFNGDEALDNRTLTWTSSDETIATVNETGIVVGIELGNVVITATDAAGMTAELAVEIIPATEYIETSSNMKFSKAVSKNNIKFGTARIDSSEDAEFALMRLAVEVKKDKKIDVSEFNPVTVIKNVDNRYVIQFSTIEETKAAYEYLKTLKKVKYVCPDIIASIDTSVSEVVEADDVEGSVDYTFYSWGAKRMGADLLSNYSAPSTTVMVAVVDSGVSSHAMLGNRLLHAYDYVSNDTNPSDENGHGTHVAGTIVDLTPSMNVKVVSYRVCNAEGRCTSTNVSNAIRDAADDGCKVINLSLGFDYYSSTASLFTSAIQYATSKGATVCVAAGNENADTSNHLPAALNLSGMLTVSAFDSSDNRSIWDLSRNAASNYGSAVDVAGPGTDIISAWYEGGYAYMSGTSMATPHISAAAAAAIIFTGNSTPSTVCNKLISVSQDMGSSGWDKYFGYGVPKMERLYTASSTPTNPSNPSTSPKLSATSVTIGKKQTVQLTVSGNSGAVSWASGNTKIATVNSYGLVTAKKKVGTATIYAYVDGKTLSCSVTVSKPKLSTTSTSVIQRLNTTLKVNYTDKKVTWKSSNSSIATVNSKGKVTGKKAGTVTITAKVDGVTLKCKVKVKANKISFTLPSIYDMSYGYWYMAPKKMYYSGSKVYMDAYVYNKTSSSKLTKFNYIQLAIYDKRDGFIIADKTFYNIGLNVRYGAKKKITFKFTGSATNDKAYNFREGYADFEIGVYDCRGTSY